MRVHAQPGASRNQIVGLHAESLKIKVKAPPEEGKANAELCAYIAGLIGVAKSRVNVVSGQSSRAKVVELSGVTLQHLSGTQLLVRV